MFRLIVYVASLYCMKMPSRRISFCWVNFIIFDGVCYSSRFPSTISFYWSCVCKFPQKIYQNFELNIFLGNSGNVAICLLCDVNFFPLCGIHLYRSFVGCLRICLNQFFINCIYCKLIYNYCDCKLACIFCCGFSY